MDINKIIIGSSPFIDSPIFPEESKKKHSKLEKNDIADIVKFSFEHGFKFWHYVADENLLSIAKIVKKLYYGAKLIQTIGFYDFRKELDFFRIIQPQYVFIHKRIVDSNNKELINNIIHFFHQKETQIILHSSNPVQIIRLEIDFDKISAIAFPVNAIGLGLDLNSGNLNQHLNSIKQIRKLYNVDIYALSPLASGRLPISYLKYSYSIADKVFIGVSSIKQIEEITLLCNKNISNRWIKDITNTKYNIPQNITLNLKSVYIELTNRCNLQCRHCYVHQNSTEINYELLNKFLHFFVESGGESIKLSGGEPLLYKHLDSLLTLCNHLQIKTTICTNGCLLNSAIINDYSQKNIKFQVSIESHIKNEFEKIRGKGTFDKVFGTLEILRQIAPQKWSCMITILPDNYEVIEETVKNIIAYLPDKIGFSLYDRKERLDMFYKEFEYKTLKKIVSIIKRIADKYGSLISNPFTSIRNMAYLPDTMPKCLIFCGQMKLTANGNIYPCVLLNEQKYNIGNIEDNLVQILKSSQAEKVYQNIWNRLNLLEDCQCCIWKYKCQGGCIGKSSDYFKVDNWCSLRLSELPNFIRLKNE